MNNVVEDTHWRSIQQKKLETELMIEVKTAKSASKKIASLDDHLTSTQREIQKKLEDQLEKRRLLEELQKETLEDEKELSRLRAEKDSLTKKKEKECERVVETVLKRKAAELLPKISSLPKIPKIPK